MLRLFKEVWRALFKNKIVVSGLTILIFLTAGIFTLLNDTYQSMQKQFNSYKQKSIGHDLTIDLNLPAEGEAFNNGYYVNGLSQNISKADYDKALHYIEIDENGKPKFKQVYKIIDFNLLKNQEFINLSTFFTNEADKAQFSSKYIKTKDFLNLYSNYNLEKESLEEQTLVNLEFNGNERSLVLKKDYLVSMYERINGEYQEVEIRKTVNQGNAYKIVFDKEYSLQDIAFVEQDSDNNLTISELPDLYIDFTNSSFNRATFSAVKGKKWMLENKLIYKVPASEVARSLGFGIEVSKNVYTRAKNTSFQNGIINIDQTDAYAKILNKKLNTEFEFSDIIQESFINLAAYQKFIFGQNRKYNIPVEWTGIQQNFTFYARKNYKLTYDEWHSKDWTGTYATFLESLIENNELTDDLKSFSYWEKTNTSFVQRYNSQGELLSKQELSEDNGSIINTSPISFTEATNVKLKLADAQYQDITDRTFNDNSIIKTKNNDITSSESINSYYSLNEPKTISEIEFQNNNLSIKAFTEITNKQIRDLRFSYIKNGALAITKQNIYKKVLEKVGSTDLVGIRESLTVDSFNENEKYVFHLINIGNSDNKILGIPINIDKLKNDASQINLNNPKGDQVDIFKSKQIPPFVSEYILKNGQFNIAPDPTYINTDITYSNVLFTNFLTKEVLTYNSRKIYKLSKYGYDVEPNFVNLGVTWEKGKLILIHPVYNTNQTKILYWENVPTEGHPNGIFELKEFIDLISSEQNQMTIKATVNPEGWVERSKEFQNLVYVPFGFRGPDSEIEAEARNKNTLTKALENTQKAFLNSDLVKEGFMTKETIYALSRAFDISITKNDFAKIFSSGQINLNILPKMILDGLYSLSHDVNGDFLNRLLVNFLTRIKQKISEHPKNEQKQYLVQEITKISNFAELAFGSSFVGSINLDAIVNIFKDPLVLIDSLIGLVNSVDFRGFTERVEDFFVNSYNKYFDAEENLVPDEYVEAHPEEVFYQRKISYHEIGVWLLKSIDWEDTKNYLNQIIDNIDLQYLIDTKSQNSPLLNILNAFLSNIGQLLDQMNAYPNDPAKSFENIKAGIKFFISSLDLNRFIQILEKKLIVNNFDIEDVIFHEEFNSYQKVQKHYATAYLSNIDWLSSFLETVFSDPGSNREMKENIINMFNLSSKGTSIKIDDNTYITIPTNDPDKLDFFDFVSILSSNPSASGTSSNEINLDSLNDFIQLEYFLSFIETQDKIVWNNMKNIEKTFLNKYFGWTGKDENNQTIEYSKEQITEKVREWKNIISKLKFKDNNNLLKENLSVSSLFSYFATTNDVVNDSLFFVITNRLLGEFDKFTPQTNYSYLEAGYPLFRTLWLLLKENGTHERKIAFLNALLSLSNDPNVIASFNSFELFQPAAQNIAGYQKTKFGVTRSLVNPQMMREVFFAKSENNDYQNGLLNHLVAEYPEFADYINNNELDLTKLFSYIASSEMNDNYGDLDVINGYHLKYHNLYSVVLDNLINGVFADADVYKNYNILNYIFETKYKQISLSSIGIPDILLNPLLRSKHPQLLIWLLADTNNVGAAAENNSNIAYFINNKLVNFETLFSNKKWTYEFLDSLLNQKVDQGGVNPVIEKDFVFQIAIDNDYIISLQKSISQNKEIYSPFGINLIETIISIMDSITAVLYSSTLLQFNEVDAYVAKANYAWLEKNNKKIYNGEIPNNPIDIVALMDQISDEYKIDIAGSQFLIIGDEMTFDYLYPVIDENNIQVNTKNQALVYVNTYGFDRVRQAFRGNVVKEYLTVKFPSDFSVAKQREVKAELEEIVQNSIHSNFRLQKVFFKTEVDPLNPERSLRISTTEGIMKSVKTVSYIFLIILVTLVTISIVFIIKRYIASKNKVIGILVAQGYTPLQIALSMTTFAFFTIFIGGVLGYFTGFMLHGAAISLLKNFWTIPIETLNFSLISFLVNIIVPLVSMSLLIVLISIRALRFKAIDLMSGIIELNINEINNKFQTLIRKKNIKFKFSSALLFNSFGKLLSFAISVILASVISVFAFGTFGVFEKSINSTYKSRYFNYKYDLQTPTKEGGAINLFELNKENIENSLYVPMGMGTELNLYQNDYFAPGRSSAINYLDKNGDPNPYLGHLITQFSVNILIDKGVSIDPWSMVYNSLPDSQKSRIIKVRDSVGQALEETQSGLVYKYETDRNGVLKKIIDVQKTIENRNSFFHYVPNEENVVDGKFYYYEWNTLAAKYDRQTITTDNKRTEYRDFLIEGYSKIALDNIEKEKKYSANDKDESNKPIYEFFVLFNGMYFDPLQDELYTYVQAKLNNTSVKLYGYQKDSEFVEITNKNGDNLVKQLDDLFIQNGSDITKEIPVAINNVSKNLFKLKVGSTFKLDVENNVNKYTTKINEAIGIENTSYQTEYKFKVVDIINTYINNEFVIPKSAADQIIGLDQLPRKEGTIPFNGILSKSLEPKQLIWSAGLYSLSGYNPSVGSFDIDGLEDSEKRDFFDGLFGDPLFMDNMLPGNLSSEGKSPSQIIKFLNPEFNVENASIQTLKEEYLKARENPSVYIEKFARIFDDKLYITSAYTLDAKEIEVGFVRTISKTVQIIITIISILSFLVSIVILIIISTILINENEKNIAIWSILGYNNREKIKMFFGIYIPFILTALLIAIPIGIGFMVLFSSFLTSTASIAVLLNIGLLTILATVVVVFLVFIVTSLLTWRNINKIKAIDLLKGK
ncbi:ABC transporter permease [Mycoplasmopsis glycophila]|uniref:Uncharacterized ABC transporter permease MG468 homolog n=1 Tax=Mycoplasmopsis glycophila TaxID=171285 RepID=A0A449AU91_9BACT|nr:ABC transporter permease [Mycoplasmopsis glycophila]VEU70052.1 Uncharacterized ABC transporter permease MG468 homolog [Mycoplasmopsis glycophila]